jgi:hypothetical protein
VPHLPRKIGLATYGGFGENGPEARRKVKSIIVYTRAVKAQNLYPKRIISPPAPNKCCAGRMEVLGRPRTDEHGRRFCYKRCRACGFALRYFLEPVPSVLLPPPTDSKGRKPAPMKDRTVVPLARPPMRTGFRPAMPVAPVAPVAAPAHPPARRPQAAPRKSAPSRHLRKPPRRRPHGVQTARKGASRRRR